MSAAAAYDGVRSGWSRASLLFEDETPYFPEATLQAIWNDGLLRDPLRTVEGQRVVVVHPGIWNVGGGPDFRGAALLIDGRSVRGDVEIHLEPEGWRQHGHHLDPAYDGVVLHVVWANPRGHERYPAELPICVAAGQLAAPLAAILPRVDPRRYPYARKVGPTRAADQLATLADEQVSELFRHRGLARLQAKAAALELELQAVGLEVVVQRRFLAAMGYASNSEACRELAQRVPAARLSGQDLLGGQALLLGAAGLLPDPSRAPVLGHRRRWLGQLWDRWWQLRGQPWGHGQPDRPEITWRRGGSRPTNSPERRLLAAAQILHRADWQLGRALLAAWQDGGSARSVISRWRRLLTVDAPECAAFLTFTRDLRRPARLLGESRLRDLLANLCLPLAMADACRRGHAADCRRARDLYCHLPLLQDNRRFQEAAHLLLVPPSRVRDVVRDACGQQGLLQFHADFMAAEVSGQLAQVGCEEKSEIHQSGS